MRFKELRGFSGMAEELAISLREVSVDGDDPR